MEINLTSEISVEKIQQIGDDYTLVHAARVSTKGVLSESKIEEKEAFGLLNYLMKHRHGTPYEHGCLTIRVRAPIKVWREWHRHRIGWSYNEESGRFKQLEPLFYIPPRERPAIRTEGFKSARPAFDLATDEEYETIVKELKQGYQESYNRYEKLLSIGCDGGLARDVLGVGIYSSCYCTANPRSIMAFLSLRTHNPSAKFVSYPLYEIEVAARKLEGIFANCWPLTHKAFCENGRYTP